MKRRFSAIISLILVLLLAMSTAVSAHSGRTDSNGGHRDNKNKSGLGSYHYHCGGYPAHLHPDGVCPYTSTPSSGTGSSTTPAAPAKDVVKIQNPPKALTVGRTYVLTCSVTRSGSSTGKVSWSSSDPTVVEVSSDGTLTAKGEGSATIIASTQTGEASFTVQVTILPVEQILLEADATQLQMGQSLFLSASVLPKDASFPELTYTSSDETIAVVSSDGEVQAVAPGTVAITATASNGVFASLELEICEIPLQSIALDTGGMELPKEGYLQPGDSVTAAVKILPSDATYPDYELVSSDEQVVKIVDGQIQAVSAGTAVVTVRSKQYEDVSGSFEITVKEEGNGAAGAVGGVLLVAAAGCGVMFYRRVKKG